MLESPPRLINLPSFIKDPKFAFLDKLAPIGAEDIPSAYSLKARMEAWRTQTRTNQEIISNSSALDEHGHSSGGLDPDIVFQSNSSDDISKESGEADAEQNCVEMVRQALT
jgi:hypothetical protein